MIFIIVNEKNKQLKDEETRQIENKCKRTQEGTPIYAFDGKTKIVPLHNKVASGVAHILTR